jgi:hypothetical protein
MKQQDFEKIFAASGQTEKNHAPNFRDELSAAIPQAKLYYFKQKAPNGEFPVSRFSRQIVYASKNKPRQLISKHAPRNWHPRVGSRVAARTDGRIVQGSVLGVKSKPWHVAAFSDECFTGCWLLLDDGTRIVVNELRPIQAMEIVKGLPDV